MRTLCCRAVPPGAVPPTRLINEAPSGQTGPSAEGTDEAPGGGPGESRHGTAPRELVQQVEEDVDPFREAGVFVGGGSQKLGVDVLIGFEGHIFFHVPAGGQTGQNRKKGRKQ